MLHCFMDVCDSEKAHGLKLPLVHCMSVPLLTIDGLLTNFDKPGKCR